MGAINRIFNFYANNCEFVHFIVAAIVFFIVWHLPLGKVANILILAVVLIAEYWYVKKSVPSNSELVDKIGPYSSVVTTFLFWVAYLSTTTGEIQITIVILLVLVFGTIAQLVVQSWTKLWESRTLTRLIISYIMLSLILVLAFGTMFIWFDKTTPASTNQWDYLFFSGGNFYSTTISMYSPSGFEVQVIQFIEAMVSFIIHTIIIVVVLDIVLKPKRVTKSNVKK